MAEEPKTSGKSKDHSDPVFLLGSGTRSYGFVENLRDALAKQEQVAAEDAAFSATFWKDVFVVRPVPWARIGQSFLAHAAVIALLLLIVQLPPRSGRVVAAQTPVAPEVIYYSPSEYLAPLSTVSPSAKKSVKGDPVASNQHILSVPPEADNRTQTIVTPSPLKITHDVPMPNVVAWNQKPAMPVAAPQREAAKLPKPAPVVPPQPQVKSDLRRNPVTLPQNVVAPAPDVKAVASSRPALDIGGIAPPPPDAKNLSSRRVSDVNLAPTVINAAPKLPTDLQRTVGRGAPSLGGGSDAVVAPPPSMNQIGAAGGNSRGSGQLIALGIHPAVSGPVSPPEGNRRGTFEASPAGKAGASGAPTIVGNPSGTGNGTGSSGKSGNGLPPGLLVGPNAGPVSTSSSSGPGSGTGTGAGGGTGSGANGNGNDHHDTSAGNLLAKLTPPSRVTALPPHETGAITETAPADVAKRVFGDRKIYTMTVNVPNLNSAGGSWQVRFAQLKGAENVPGELTAPEPMREVDPAYPLQLMKLNVEGTVILYAIIQSDGTVSKVQILRSADDRLDQYAAAALAKWTFRPGRKNGTSVPLEAVVVVPFKAIRQKTNF